MLKLSPKIFFLCLSFLMLTTQSLVSCVTLRCEYDSFAFSGLEKDVYYCYIKDSGVFTDGRMRIDSVRGRHLTGYAHDNVEGIRIESISSLNFFPQNLENVFKNLIIIQIYPGNLQEINQEDLKVFPKLQRLDLQENKITVIEENLFIFNPDLRAILLHSNQISHIDPNVFDHLDHLSILWLSGNKCKNDLNNALNSKSDVLELIQRVRNGECTSEVQLLKKKEQINENVTQPQADNEDDLTTVSEERSVLLRRINELRDKNENLLNSKVELLESLNEWKDKYINLQVKLIECEKMVENRNQER